MSKIPESRTFPRLVAELAHRYPERPAIVGSGRRIDYRALQAETLRIARRLYQLDVAPGDKVAVLMGNQPEWISTVLAIVSLGAVAVPLNTWATPSELEYLISHSDATLLVAAPSYLKSDYGQIMRGFEPLATRFPLLRGILGVGPAAALPAGWAPLFDGATDSETVGDAALAAVFAAVQPDDVALILYTSGSTAAPKGVQLQHRGLIENSWATGERQRITEHDKLWLGVSLFWGMASATALWNIIAHGACVVLQEHFDAGEALRLIEAERCSVFYGTPNMIQAMFEHPERPARDLSSLRTGGTSGMREHMLRAMELGITQICNIYGLTESHGHTHMSDAGDSAEQRAANQGRLMPGFQAKVVDATGAEVAPGTVGELLLKGYITAGYYKQEELTAQSYDADGYFRTGDLVCMDEQDCMQFRGRLKEMIKSGGINISPVEVEFMLKKYPGVAMAQVVGVPDPVQNEILAAVIVPLEGVTLDSEAIIGFCRVNMAAYKVPRLLRIVREAELPLTTTGKYQKNKLAETFFGGQQ
ncbi:MAG: AMP-binding protein [Pseudomonadota bacterium]